MNQVRPARERVLCEIVLKTMLKQLINVRNRHREGAGVFNALTRAKDQAIPKMADLLSTPVKHGDT